VVAGRPEPDRVPAAVLLAFIESTLHSLSILNPNRPAPGLNEAAAGSFGDPSLYGRNDCPASEPLRSTDPRDPVRTA
jgi:hypothetical protein